jgi:hypothetical protein
MLVTPNKLAIPILWEFVENQSPDVTKQDCELKAFHRLLPRFKAYFPRTVILNNIISRLVEVKIAQM